MQSTQSRECEFSVEWTQLRKAACPAGARLSRRSLFRLNDDAAHSPAAARVECTMVDEPPLEVRVKAMKMPADSRWVAVFVVLAISSLAQQQDDSRPSATNVRGAEYPRMMPLLSIRKSICCGSGPEPPSSTITNLPKKATWPLEKAGIPNVFVEFPGLAHEWQTWRKSLYDIAPRLFR
jgi:hypothetical protein